MASSYWHTRQLSRYSLLSPGQPHCWVHGPQRLLGPGPNPVPVRRFCSEFPSSPQSGNLAVPALDQVQYSSQLSQDRTVQLVSLEPSQGQGQGQGQDLGQYLSVHDYSDCKSMSEEEGVTETRAQQFSAKLVSLYRKHNIRTS